MVEVRSEHALALIALILGVIGGVLLCKGAIDVALRLLDGGRNVNVNSLLFVGIGIIVIIASAMFWKGSYLAGGVINIVLGLLSFSYGKDAEGLMVIISGVLGILAPKIEDW